MESRPPAELDEPCLWLPGHPVVHRLSACRPPRLQVRPCHGRKTMLAVPASDLPTAQAPGESANRYEMHAFAAVALCGW
ncbi:MULTISPECIES: hypothetical protein [unclassified Kribbella]|uniref:hypothetical protein n=1 Tax=unclassified Kribbella TaxID=2644121 RepID=UPI0030789544